MAQKFYAVWAGRQTGVFPDWATTQRAVDGYAGARFKSFPTRAEAEKAFARGGYASIPPKPTGSQKAGTAESERRAARTSHQFDVRIFCDGACEPNPGNAGSGIVVYRAGELAELWFGLYNPTGTNNTAELNALYHALRMAEAEINTGKTVEVCSDSAYSINCIRSWAANWEKKGWKKSGHPRCRPRRHRRQRTRRPHGHARRAEQRKRTTSVSGKNGYSDATQDASGMIASPEEGP